jgi:hypothetical protein
MMRKEENNKIHAVFPDRSGQRLPGLLYELWREQLGNWKQFAENHQALKDIRLRTVRCGGISVKLQWNPRRMASTSALVSNGAADRPCFLCAHQLAASQKGILYYEHYLILCNPAPIFDRHYTVPHIRHIPQLLEDSFSDMLQLSRDLGEAFVVFYNGSRCGASAPDHLHFQVCPANGIPMPERNFPKSRVYSVGSCKLFAFRGLSRGLCVFSGRDLDSLQNLFFKYLGGLRSFFKTQGEPKVNVICSYRNDKWQLAVYARSNHRPDKYYLPETGRILVSPGAVDMSGLMILPIERDFERLTAADIWQIYREVAIDDQIVETVIESII